jgi:hypothetical protein
MQLTLEVVSKPILKPFEKGVLKPLLAYRQCEMRGIYEMLGSNHIILHTFGLTIQGMKNGSTTCSKHPHPTVK